MKKLAFVLITMLFVFSSCSSDDPIVSEPELTTNGIILKRAIKTNGSNVINEDYFYNGNKLDKIISSNGSRFEFTYTGNLITQIEYFENSVLKDNTEFQYNSLEKMTQRKSFNYNNNTAYRAEFTYNIDGTVSVIGFIGDFINQNAQIVNKKVFLFTNGDVEKMEAYVVISGVNHTRTTHYTYDTKNSPSNYALGYNKIKFWDTGTYGNSHNNTSIQSSTTENTDVLTSNLTYTYNTFDYPVTANYGSISVQYLYQQP